MSDTIQVGDTRVRAHGLRYNEDGKARFGQLYRLADRPAGYMGILPVPNRIAGMPTGEKRPPRKGEWYLSGAIPECYRAPNDLTDAYHIVMLVEVQTITTYNVLPYSPEREQGQ